jgi:hypothetical protein
VSAHWAVARGGQVTSVQLQANGNIRCSEESGERFVGQDQQVAVHPTQAVDLTSGRSVLRRRC